jgi:hypothetical protein
MFVDLALAVVPGSDPPLFVIARLPGRCGPAGLTRPMHRAMPDLYVGA